MPAVSRFRGWQPFVGVIAVVIALAGCGGTPSRSSPTPTSIPTLAASPTPEPTPTPEEALAAACEGIPMPWAAPYAGELHPLLVADRDWLHIVNVAGNHPLAEDVARASYAINQKWLNGEWTSPMIQLVVCTWEGDVVDVDSCGTYTRDDGVTGELLRGKATQKVRVVIAKTGDTLQTEIISGALDECPRTYSSVFSDVSRDPPWKFEPSEVTDAQVNEYATAVSTQSAE